MKFPLRFVLILTAVIVAAFLVLAAGACGGDEEVFVTVQFADGVFVSGREGLWGEPLQLRIESGAVTCGEVTEEGTLDCQSYQTSGEADWVPSGLIAFR